MSRRNKKEDKIMDIVNSEGQIAFLRRSKCLYDCTYDELCEIADCLKKYEKVISRILFNNPDDLSEFVKK